MNTNATIFTPHHVKAIGDLEPVSITYPSEAQMALLGFLNPFRWRTEQGLLQQSTTMPPKWALEPDWNRSIPDLQDSAKKLKAGKFGPLRRFLLFENGEKQAKLQTFELFDADVKKGDMWASIFVPGLADAEPALLVGDWLSISFLDVYGIRNIKSRILTLNRASSIVTFLWPETQGNPPAKSFKANVRFFMNQLFASYQQQAVEVASAQSYKLAKILYPSTSTLAPNEISHQSVPLQFVNPKLNSKQKEAVNLVVSPSLDQSVDISNSSHIKIVYGPAGTGKTMVCVEAILQLFKNQSRTGRIPRILVCAPSISAADTLALRLLTGLQEMSFDSPSRILFRFNDGVRSQSSLPTLLLSICLTDPETGRFTLPDLQKLLSFQILVTTCLDAGLLFDCGLSNQDLSLARSNLMESTRDSFMRLGLNPTPINADEKERLHHWTHVFVDEAAQASEAEILIPITTAWYPGLQICLFGDPRQLPCRVFSKENANACSLLERLLECPLYSNKGALGRVTNPYNPQLVVVLQHNYRSHPSLLMTPSSLFYHDLLLSCGDSSLINKGVGFMALLDDEKPCKGYDWPVYFHHLQGQDLHSMYESESLASWANRDEADMVVEYVLKIIGEKRATLEEIGVIAPYRGQVALIRALLRKAGCGEINVGNVLDFQGKEYSVVILSCVRSVNALKNDPASLGGFLHNPKEFNVAITRSMSLLVVIGNEDLLGKDAWIYQFILFCHRNKRSSRSQDGSFLELPPNSESGYSHDGPPSFTSSLVSSLEKRYLPRTL